MGLQDHTPNFIARRSFTKIPLRRLHLLCISLKGTMQAANCSTLEEVEYKIAPWPTLFLQPCIVHVPRARLPSLLLGYSLCIGLKWLLLMLQLWFDGTIEPEEMPRESVRWKQNGYCELLLSQHSLNQTAIKSKGG